ncbi:MAG: single-stranded DNA-binding protein [Bacteroidales bacterium]|nr:single-stranded DNA-binding protein [Candidatus Egerieousia equi]
MKSVNRVEIKGIVGRDPQINTVSKRKVANFSVATEFSWQASNGEYKKETTWHSVCAWEGYGIADLEAIGKGSRVSIVGRLRTRSYTDKDGVDKYVTEVLAEELDIISEQPRTQQNSRQTGGSGSGRSTAAAHGEQDEDF